MFPKNTCPCARKSIASSAPSVSSLPMSILFSIQPEPWLSLDRSVSSQWTSCFFCSLAHAMASAWSEASKMSVTPYFFVMRSTASSYPCGAMQGLPRPCSHSHDVIRSFCSTRSHASPIRM